MEPVKFIPLREPASTLGLGDKPTYPGVILAFPEVSVLPNTCDKVRPLDARRGPVRHADGVPHAVIARPLHPPGLVRITRKAILPRDCLIFFLCTDLFIRQGLIGGKEKYGQNRTPQHSSDHSPALCQATLHVCKDLPTHDFLLAESGDCRVKSTPPPFTCQSFASIPIPLPIASRLPGEPSPARLGNPFFLPHIQKQVQNAPRTHGPSVILVA